MRAEIVVSDNDCNKLVWCLVPATSAQGIVLSREDIEEIDRFHTAWCEENHVAKTDLKALEVASALIEWYTTDRKYRERAIVDLAPSLPRSEEIEKLLRQIS